MQKPKPHNFGKFVFIALFGAMALTAFRLVSKPTNLLQGVLSPLPPSSLLVGSSPNSQNDGPVDVAKFSAIEWTTNGVDLALHRPPALAVDAVEVTLVGSTNLVTATWEPYTNVTFAAGETNLAVFVDQAQLDAHAVSNACFFAFINAGDSDGDGLADWHERFNLDTDPDNADSDGDGLPDGWECANGFDPNFAPDALADADEDGLPNLYEFHHGTDPWLEDSERVPKIVAGGTGGNSAPTLAAALAMATPYSVVEVADGVHQGGGWGDIHLPEFPVVVTSADQGRSRKATIRSTDLSVFYLSSTQTTHTVVQGLRIELAATGGIQHAFFIGGNLPFAGEPAAATFRNITVRMQNPATQFNAWFIRHHTTNRLVVAGCTVNAAGSTYARGIYAVDSPPMSVENCSFVNFPPDGPGTTSVGIQYESTLANWGNAPNPIPVEVVNCLFDRSFTNAYPWARITGAVPYRVSMANCLMPAEPQFEPDEMSGLVVADARTDWSGHIAPDSPARGAGLPVLFSFSDMDGEAWPEPPPIGADAYSEPADDGVDADGDGLSDFDERTVHGTDPFAADSDGDGLSDSDELSHGTDPLDVLSFHRRVDFAVTGCEPLPGVTNYVGWSASPRGWNASQAVDFVEGVSLSGSFDVEGVDGAVYVTAYRDFNRNGVCDRECEPFVVRTVGASAAVSRLSFVFGDVDADNVGDKAEFDEGTNPNQSLDYLLSGELVFTNACHVAGFTNVLSYGMSDAAEMATVRIAGPSWSTSISGVHVTNGCLLAVAYTDVDKDGAPTPGVDPVYTNRFTGASNGNELAVKVGDLDVDGICDVDEFREGTDLFGKTNFCLNLSFTCTEIFQTTNALTFELKLGRETIWGPAVVEGNVWSHDFGHVVATNGGSLALTVWDDANSNLECDDGETFNLHYFSVAGHDMAVTNRMEYGNFDRDKDNLPDWWEIANGLPSDGATADEYADPDNDGLINLHEFWAGTNPLVPDGSNTFVWALAHSIDERIKGKTCSTSTTEVYTDYTVRYNALTNELSLTVTPNEDCWAHGLDFSAVGICSKNHGATTIAHGLFPTAISDRHIIFAKHCGARTNDCYRFRTPDGIYTNLHLAGFMVHPDDTYDLMVGILDGALPPSIKPVKFLPSDYRSYIGRGQRLPTLRLNQWAQVSVQEIDSLPSPSNPYTDVIFRFSEDLQRSAFFKAVQWGDSGHPSFFLCGDDLIFLFTAHHTFDWRKVTAVPAISLKDEIEEMMNRLSVDFNVTNRYQVQEYDFTKYRLGGEE